MAKLTYKYPKPYGAWGRIPGFSANAKGGLRGPQPGGYEREWFALMHCGTSLGTVAALQPCMNAEELAWLRRGAPSALMPRKRGYIEHTTVEAANHALRQEATS